MGTLQEILCLFFGHLIAAHSFMRYEDPMFPPDFGGFFENEIFPIERNFDFLPFDAIFNSWRSWTGGLQEFTDFPSFMNIPSVQVSCDESKLTVLVDKNAFGLTLTPEVVQLGNGCYSNGELQNQLVFAYGLEECGTTPVLHSGLQMFTNSLHLNLKALPAQWQTPPTVYVSCIPKRLHEEPNFISTPPVDAKRFTIQAMNPSWTDVAESNIYTRGQEINLQVSGKTRPDQQLFIQACFTSASPEAQIRPRHAVILNKGCSSSVGAPHTVAQFTASPGENVVNFVLTASSLVPELYVHCNVIVSDKGVTSASKACNYNASQSRWEELSGNVTVCSCCSSKCKGLSVKSLSDDAKASLTIGPFIIVDTNHVLLDSEPQMTPSASDSMPSGLPSDGDMIDSGFLSKDALLSSQGVVVVSQDPSARLTLWLPGQMHGQYINQMVSQSEDGMLGQLPSDGYNAELQPLPMSEEALVALPESEIVGQTLKDYNGGSSLWDMNLLPVADGWPIPEMSGNVVFTEQLQRKRFGRSGSLDQGAVQDAAPQPTEISINLMLVDKPKSAGNAIAAEPQKKLSPTETESNYFNPRATHTMEDESSQMPMDPMTFESEPIIRSKLEFTKSADGSQTLSYEEEVKREESKCVQGRPKRDSLPGKREPGLKGLHSTFLHLLRRMDKAE